MEHHRIIILGTAAALLSCGALVPAAAMAGGPLLSGYGGPGEGAQSIIGATLLNGPSGGSGGGSSGGGSAGGNSVGGSSAPGSSSAGGSRTAGGTASRGSAQGAKTGTRGGGSGHSPSTGAGSPGADPTSSPSAGASIGTGASWFSAADLLAFVLAAGALALTAVATVRLARSNHDA